MYLEIRATDNPGNWCLPSEELAKFLEPYKLQFDVVDVLRAPQPSIIDLLTSQFQSAIAAGDHVAAEAWLRLLRAY